MLSLTDVFIEVMLLYVGPPDVGPNLGLVDPHAPPVVSFLWLGLLLTSAPPVAIVIVRSELIQTTSIEQQLCDQPARYVDIIYKACD